MAWLEIWRKKIKRCIAKSISRVARPAGLEPATLGLEGRCSIQMSYGRIVTCGLSEDNEKSREVVGAERFELPTLWSQTRCATRLRYAPTCFREVILEEGEIIRCSPDRVNA